MDYLVQSWESGITGKKSSKVHYRDIGFVVFYKMFCKLQFSRQQQNLYWIITINHSTILKQLMGCFPQERLKNSTSNKIVFQSESSMQLRVPVELITALVFQTRAETFSRAGYLRGSIWMWAQKRSPVTETSAYGTAFSTPEIGNQDYMWGGWRGVSISLSWK